MLKGIDVSVWQGDIDWDKVKGIGARDFAIIRASHSGAKDAKLERNKAEARRVGILRGFYHYAYPSGNDPVQDARRFVGWVGSLQEGELLALDVEEPWGGDWVGWAKAWLDEVFRLTGRRPLVYMNDNFDNIYDWKRVVAGDYGLWLAFWDNTTDRLPATDWPFVAMKQFIVGNAGAVPGVAGRIDMDVFYGDHSAFRKYGMTAGGTPIPSQPPAPEPAPAPRRKYVVRAGDSLWKIAQAHGTSVQHLLNLNPAYKSAPDRIFPDQIVYLDSAGPAAPAPSSPTYTVQKGDTLSAIASRHGTTWQRLYDLNRGVIGGNPNLIRPDQVLKLR